MDNELQLWLGLWRQPWESERALTGYWPNSGHQEFSSDLWGRLTVYFYLHFPPRLLFQWVPRGVWAWAGCRERMLRRSLAWEVSRSRAGMQVLRCSRPHGAIPCKSPGSIQQPQANKRAGGTHDASPRHSIPSVIGPACPGCLPSRREGCDGKGEGSAG